MSTINNQNQVTEVSLSDLIPIYSNIRGVTQQMAVSQMLAFFTAQLGGSQGLVTQYSNPTATGFNVNVENLPNVWLIIRPLAVYANGTITLPAVPANLDTVNVVITQAVTTLVVDGNGNSVIGDPGMASANDTFTFRYDGVNKTWFRA